MATTANLNAPKLSTGQAGKEPTINEAFDIFDAALGGRVSKSVAGGSNVTLTAAEARGGAIELTGVLTGHINVDWPSSGGNRLAFVYNNTTGSFYVTFRYGAGTGVIIPQGHGLFLYHNGANAYPASPFIRPWTAAQTVPSVPACRAYHNASQSVANNTLTALALNQERYDTDEIHDPAANNSRLVCKTAGLYAVIGHAVFAAHATGYRQLSIRLNGATYISPQNNLSVGGADATNLTAQTQYFLNVNDYVELIAYQTSGGALNVLASANQSPEFMMARIG